MILHPGILALLVSSLLIGMMTLYAAGYGIVILRRWDIASGSELQLVLERRTYLISTIVAWFMAFQAISLFLFIRTADGISPLFVGAMCAVGTLSANVFGFPTLLLKIVTFVLAGLWLILNHADSKGYDYPLTRTKYLLLLVTAPFVLVETVVQWLYFLGLKPDLITSCCGSLFSEEGRSIAREIVATPSRPTEVVFYACIAATVVTGRRVWRKGTGGYFFAALAGITLAAAIVSLISFISLYYYELPTHHCPFCLLQKEYGYIGYPLYLLLFAGGVAGLGVGILEPHREKESIREALPGLQRRLAALSVSSFVLFGIVTGWQILFSQFRLEGY